MKKTAITVRFMCLILTLCLLTGVAGVTASAKTKSVTVKVNGSALKLKHKPKVVKKNVMLPAAEVFKSLGATTEYVKENKVLIVTKGSTLFTVKVKSKKLNVGDLVKQKTKTYNLKQAPKLVKGTVYVSTQTIQKALGAKVKWNAKKKKVTITYK